MNWKKDARLFGLFAVSLLFVTQPAEATSILPGVANTTSLTVGTYEHSPTSAFVGNGVFSFNYYFDVSAGSPYVETFLSAHVSLPEAGQPTVANLNLTWEDSLGNPLAGQSIQVTDDSGQVTENGLPAFFLPYVGITTAFDYILNITGDASNNGRYNLTLDVTNTQAPPPVPLPGAVFLLGSVLAGAGVFGRFRRKAQPAV